MRRKVKAHNNISVGFIVKRHTDKFFRRYTYSGCDPFIAYLCTKNINFGIHLYCFLHASQFVHIWNYFYLHVVHQYGSKNNFNFHCFGEGISTFYMNTSYSFHKILFEVWGLLFCFCDLFGLNSLNIFSFCKYYCSLCMVVVFLPIPFFSLRLSRF